MSSYTQHLGSKRCCELRGQGPQGPQGHQGASTVGAMGYQGSTGSLGYQGATGRSCRGTTGAQGAIGPAGGAQGDIGAQGATGASGLAGFTGSWYGETGSSMVQLGGVWYDTTANTLNYSLNKTFIIDHPLDVNKLLVHACLEGPEAGVYYRGIGEITNNVSTTIKLPDYVEKLASDFTIQITPIYNGSMVLLNAGEVINNKFSVYGENCKFYWTVHGKRLEINNIEPNKNDVSVKGSGPYLWI